MSVQPQLRDTTQGPARLFGTWGTTAQCNADKAGGKQKQRFFPLVINNEWIKQGMIYCHLQWQGHSSLGTVTRAQALAQCGEDTLREYQISLNLENKKLIVRWSKDFSTKALEAC